MAIFEITTPRLILRTPREDDAEAITRAKRDVWPTLQLWMSWAYAGEETLEATLAFIRSPVAQGMLAAFSRDSGELVTMTGIDPVDGKPGEFSTGYWGVQKYLGRGYATEATNAAIRYAFGAKAATAVHICYYEGNDKSRRVIEKLGFTFSRTEAGGHKRCLDGVPLDVHHYVMRDPAVLPPLDVSWT